jgi:hypothetical protein
MRKSSLALAAFIAAVACTDSTSPKDRAPQTASVDSVAKPTVSASLVAPASLFSSYKTTSSHWTHITTMMTDFYYSWTPAERTWAGRHYDYAMSGTGSAWRAANPAVGHFPYALLWTTIIGGSAGLSSGYVADMKAWFAAHPTYRLEKAFVHRKGYAADSAHRVYYNHWGSNRWAINPADPGAIAYTVNRVQRITAGENGVFFDESASGDMGAHLGAMTEFPSAIAYNASIAKLLRSIRTGISPKIIMLNTAEYTTPADSVNAIAAGAVHLEMFNNFKYSGMIPRWVWIEKLAKLGVFVDVVSTYGSQDLAHMTTSYPRGNSATNVQRAKLWELASYYLAVTSNPKLIALQLENQWSKPYSTLWTKAQEANIGHPTAIRVQKSHGTDPLGNSYIVYTRDFDRALVVLRLQQGWGSQTYTDGTAITVPLPAGETWIPLNADGTVGTAVKSIRLRNSEAAIMLKGSKM